MKRKLHRRRCDAAPTRLPALRQARERANLTQIELAARIGVSKVSICCWETNPQAITGRNLIKLHAALGISVDCILGLDGRQDV